MHGSSACAGSANMQPQLDGLDDVLGELTLSDGLDQVLAELTLGDMDCRGVTGTAASVERGSLALGEQAVSSSLAGADALRPDMPAYRAASRGAYLLRHLVSAH